MNREQRTIAVCALTVFLLGLSNFLKFGEFIFTFPVNDYLFLLITCYFLWFSFKKSPLDYSLLLAFALFSLLGNWINYELVLNTEQMTWLTEGLLTDASTLLSHLIFCVLAFRFFRFTGWNYYPLYFIGCVLVLFTGEFLDQIWITASAFLLFTISLKSYKSLDDSFYKPIYYLFVLLNILNLTTIISICFMV